MQILRIALRQLVYLYSLKQTHYLLGILIILFFTSCYIVLVLNRYWQFEYFYTDNVHFDSVIWKVSRGLEPVIHHSRLGDINKLGDHFSPTIFLLSPLYWFTIKQEVILVASAVLYGLSAILAMQIGFKLVKSRIVTFSLLVAYFLYLGTQNAFIYGFHEVNLMPLFFMLMLIGFFYKKIVVFSVALILLLLTKESLVFVVIGFALFIIISGKANRILGEILVFISLLYYVIVTGFLIPYFSRGHFFYTEIPIPSLYDIFHRLWYPTEKLSTIFISLATFGFLPILNLTTLPLLFSDFIIRYLFSVEGLVTYRLVYHYNLVVAPILFFSSVHTVYLLQKKFAKIIAVLVVSIVLINIYLNVFRYQRGPILLVFNPGFYQTTVNNEFLWKFVDKVPKTGSIMTQNHLGYAFSHQPVYLFPSKTWHFPSINTDYIVVDLRLGQNANNYFPIGEELLRELIPDLIKSNRYDIFYSNGTQYILKKSISKTI